MRSVSIKVGPFTAAGSYEFDTVGCCLSSTVLAISGTCSAKVEFEQLPNYWVAEIAETPTTASATSDYTLGKRRLTITSAGGGNATVYFNGIRG